MGLPEINQKEPDNLMIGSIWRHEIGELLICLQMLLQGIWLCGVGTVAHDTTESKAPWSDAKKNLSLPVSEFSKAGNSTIATSTTHTSPQLAPVSSIL